MRQTRLYSILWFLIFTVMYIFFKSVGWDFLSILALIMGSLSGFTFVRTFIYF